MGVVTCYYDGVCGLCRVSVRWLRALDWLGRLDFEDMAALSDAALPVERAAAMRGMPARTGDGRVLVGFKAVRLALGQTPLGLPIALALRLPGLSHLGERAYDAIAARRGRDACPVPPGPKRESD